MAIDAVVGIPGSGKSYWGVSEGLRRWIKGYKKARDRHHRLLATGQRLDADPVKNMPSVNEYQGLAANFDFDLWAIVRYLVLRAGLAWREAVVLTSQIQTISSIQNLLDLWNCICIFDEAQLWFNARDYALFPTEALAFWTQHRKGGIDFILITQKFEMVDTNIRGLVANVYRARPVPWYYIATRRIGAKLGLVERPDLPVFRYTNVMDEEGTSKGLKVKGALDAATRVSTVQLDPLIAACYNTMGQFYTPAKQLHDASGSVKSRISTSLGLTFDLTKFRQNKFGKQSQLPGLDVKTLAVAYINDLDVGAMVADLQQHAYEQIVSRGVVGDKVVSALPKENPPASTGGAGQPLREYSGKAKGWGNRGLN